MGEVYRARDTTLGRDVAIKVLPPSVARNKELRARFAREARLLGSLQHPGIASVHSFEEEPVAAIVMELVPGKTLDERLRRSPLQAREALPIFRQLAEALEAAHELGIIHRDLKPANIKVTPEGRVKVLDFGLAKSVASGLHHNPLEAGNTQTLTAHTARGVVLGTVPYMSPEQARGERVDLRTDVWAFGCLLFEALAGERTFAGESAADVTAQILEREPDWSRLPDDLDPRIRLLLERCLRKEPERRLQHLGNARVELEDIASASSLSASFSGSSGGAGSLVSSAAGPPEATTFERLWMPLLVTSILAAGVIGWTLPRGWASDPGPPPGHGPVLRFQLAEKVFPAPHRRLSISADGTRIAYDKSQGASVRTLDSEELLVLDANGAGAQISPDGDWLAYHYFVKGLVNKISLGGGTPVTLGAADIVRGMSWSDNGLLVYSNRPSGGDLVLVRDDGEGEPEILLSPSPDQGEDGFRWPTFLPGGQDVLFTVVPTGTPDFDNWRIDVVSRTDGSRKTLVEKASDGRYLESERLGSWLLYSQSGSVFAAPFDREKLAVVGPAIEVLPGVAATVGAAPYAVSRNGTLAYAPGVAVRPPTRYFFVDESGNEEEAAITADEESRHPRISPDGRFLVLQHRAGGLWVHDFQRAVTEKRGDGGVMVTPIWSHDGETIYYNDGPRQLFERPADGSGEPRQLTFREDSVIPTSASPDGRFLAVNAYDGDRGCDVYLVELPAGDDPRASIELRPLVTSGDFEANGRFSRDGEWLAYVAVENDQRNIFVTRPEAGSATMQLSSSGGGSPLWSPNGQELFFISEASEVWAVRVPTNPGDEWGLPERLFESDKLRPGYDVSFPEILSDGRFLGSALNEPPDLVPVHVVVNWFTELEELLG